MRKHYQTQWAGQFGAAHELTRRGYLVTFTAGNAPATDLLCQSPSGEAFPVQVKSLKTKTYFLYQASLLEGKKKLYFIFVLIPESLQRDPEYFILNKEQFLRVAEEQENILKESEKRHGKPYAKFSPGINYSVLARHDFRDAWGNLPD